MPQQVVFPTVSSDTFRLECEMKHLGSEKLQLLPRGRKELGAKARLFKAGRECAVGLRSGSLRQDR